VIFEGSGYAMSGCIWDEMLEDCIMDYYYERELGTMRFARARGKNNTRVRRGLNSCNHDYCIMDD